MPDWYPYYTKARDGVTATTIHDREHIGQLMADPSYVKARARRAPRASPARESRARPRCACGGRAIGVCAIGGRAEPQAAFFRDPLERLLSAYLDKLANGRPQSESFAIRLGLGAGLANRDPELYAKKREARAATPRCCAAVGLCRPPPRTCAPARRVRPSHSPPLADAPGMRRAGMDRTRDSPRVAETARCNADECDF